MKHKRPNPFLVRQLLATICITSPAYAADQTWKNAAGTSSWTTGGNWVGGAAPGATSGVASNDTATFNGAANLTVTPDATRNIKNITFDTATAGAFTITGGGLVLTHAGAITINANVVNTQTINTNLLLSTVDNSTYSFINNSSTSAAKLNIGGNITGGVNATGEVVTLGGANGGTISGIIAHGTGGSVGVTKSGAGTWTLTGANTYTLATTVNEGTLQLSGASGALALSASALTLNGGYFLIDNTTAAGGNNNARIANTQAMSFNSGSFIYKGADAAATNSTETIGALTSTNGGVFTTTFGGTNTAVVTATSFVHTVGNSTVLFNGVNLGKDTASTASVARVILTTAPVAANLVGTTVGAATGINSAVKNTKVVNYLVGEATTTTGGLGTATGTANTFLTYNATTGLRPLNPTDEFTPNATTTGNNIYLTTGTTAASNNAINSLVLNGGSLSIATGITSTNTSGALLFVTSNSITGAGTGALAFGAAEAQITVNTGITGTIGAIVTGSGGLTKSGGGTLNLNGANSYTGTTTIAAGTLALNGTNTTTGLTMLTGGAITGSGALNGLATINNFSKDAWSLSSDITRSGHLTYNGAAGGATSLDLSGAINLGASTNVFYVSNAGTQSDSNAITLSGSTSNTMGLTFQGENPAAIPLHTVTLAKTGGAIAVSGDITIGQGGHNWQRGIVQLGGNEQIADTAQVTLGTSGYNGNTQFRLLGFSETIAGLNSSATSFSGSTAGNAIVENGSGAVGTSTLTLSGSGTYTFGPKQNTNLRLRDGSTGKLAITKDGIGTQIFNAVNELSYTGATTINDGILSIRGSNLTGSAVTLAGGTLDLQTSTINTAISGTTGQVTVSAGTTTNFGGSNKTYSVDTVISGGTTILLQTAANSLSANSIHSIGTGAILRTGNLAGSVKALTGVGSVDLNGSSAILTIADGAGQDFGGAIGGTGGLIKSGAGTQTLSGANTYDGATSIKNGSLILAGGNDRIETTGSVTLGDTSTSGKLVLGNTTAASNQTLAGLSTTGSGGSVVGAHASTDSVLTLNIASTNTFNGTLGGGGTNENKLALTKAGAGSLTLNAANTYTGTTTVQQGTLVLGSAGTISSTLVLGVSGGTVGALDVTAKALFSQASVSGSGTLNIGTGKTINVTTALAPGFSPGTLNVTGNLSLVNGTNNTATTMELASNLGLAGVDFDFVNVSEIFTLDGILNIVSFGGYNLGQIETYNLFDATTFAGDFDAVNIGGNAATFSSNVWTTSFGGYNYSFDETNGVLTVVPEPRAALLGGLGMLMLLRRRRV